MRHASRWRTAAAPFMPALARSETDLFSDELFGRAPGGLMRPSRAFESDVESDAGEQAVPDPNAWCCKRQAITAVARVEKLHWTSPNGAALQESAASQRPFLVRYWMATGLGAAAAANHAAQSAADVDDFAWSAAFICFVMRMAGVTQADGFNFGSRHMDYIVGALRNRERSTPGARFHLVDATEIRAEAIPEPGDLICFNRPDNGVMTTHTYANLRTRFWGNNGQNQNVAVSGKSHCALVLGRAQQGAQQVLETIGGNEGDSVLLQRNVVIDANGGIPNPQANANPGPIFGMIKMLC